MHPIKILIQSVFVSAFITMMTLSPAATAQDQQTEPSLMSFGMAEYAMEAAEAYAKENGWDVTILITDQNNNPVMLHRMDGASIRTLEFANRKALVTAATGLTSGEYGQKVEAGEIDEIEGGVTFQGAVPVYIEGELIGIIATSGARAFEDEEVSMAGARALGGTSAN